MSEQQKKGELKTLTVVGQKVVFKNDDESMVIRELKCLDQQGRDIQELTGIKCNSFEELPLNEQREFYVKRYHNEKRDEDSFTISMPKEKTAVRLGRLEDQVKAIESRSMAGGGISEQDKKVVEAMKEMLIKHRDVIKKHEERLNALENPSF